MNFIKTLTVNNGIDTDVKKYIALSEQYYISQLEEAAEKICSERIAKPIVLISGPSGSGKTTSALKISDLIRKKGIGVKTISMDNYFLPSDMGELPKDENGNIDLESPLRLDIELFTEHLEKIYSREPIDVPIFDFTSQARTGSIHLAPSEGEITVIEGIHALNPQVTGDSDSFTSRLYISVRTRLTLSDGEMLHPRLIRLMRRLSRDRLFRGRKIKDIFEMFESVSRGEELYIMPYKARSSTDIDTFIPFEASVYSCLLLADLEAASDEMSDNENYRKIMRFLKELHPLKPALIPPDSLIREFIGT